MQRWVWFFLGLLAYANVSHYSHKVTFICGLLFFFFFKGKEVLNIRISYSAMILMSLFSGCSIHYLEWSLEISNKHFKYQNCYICFLYFGALIFISYIFTIVITFWINWFFINVHSSLSLTTIFT